MIGLVTHQKSDFSLKRRYHIQEPKFAKPDEIPATETLSRGFCSMFYLKMGLITYLTIYSQSF
jgi:hypothetical protein